jgi:hypothetical protein
MPKPRYVLILLPAIILVIAGLACNLSQISPQPSPTVSEPGVLPLPTEMTPDPTGLTPDPTQVLPDPSPTLRPTQEPGAIPASPEPTLVPAAELQVVYTNEGNIWLWKEDGSNNQLTSSGDAASVRISDDGLVIAYLRLIEAFTVELWAVNSDGSHARLLMDSTDFDALNTEHRYPESLSVQPFDLQFVPGSHILAFNTHQILIGPGLAIFDDLQLVDTDTGELTTLLPSGSGGMFYYSPDGSQIAIVTSSEIDLVNSDGSNRREAVLTYPEVITYSEYRYYAKPVWAEDSSSLRVAIPPSNPLIEPVQPTRLWHIPVDGTPAFQTGSVYASPVLFSEPVFSHDLSRIIYLQETGGPLENQRQILIANSDGSEEVAYHTSFMLELRGWAGSSERFTFSQGPEMALILAEVGGGMQPLAPNNAQIFDLRWIDSQRFVYFQPLEVGGFGLWLGDIDQPPHLIDELPGFFSDFDF